MLALIDHSMQTLGKRMFDSRNDRSMGSCMQIKLDISTILLVHGMTM
jgi:hypothetical protein